jgi:hypothetical protein
LGGSSFWPRIKPAIAAEMQKKKTLKIILRKVESQRCKLTLKIPTFWVSTLGD